MNALKSIELLNEYATCRKCGSEVIGNGEGSIEITDDTFIRKCKCGWNIKVVEDKEEKRESQTAIDTNSLEEKARELKREYDRQWRKQNPDKVKKYNQNRWLKKAQRLIES